MLYLTLKHIHVTSIITSFCLFLIRGGLVLSGRGLPASPVLRALPHVVDTVLLASAISLAIMLRQYPLTDAWLTAKVAGLVVYIVLGSLALKRAKTQRSRVAAFAAACLVFGFIVSVARAHHPLGFFALGR